VQRCRFLSASNVFELELGSDGPFHHYTIQFWLLTSKWQEHGDDAVKSQAEPIKKKKSQAELFAH
jgi:hypothetical protein